MRKAKRKNGRKYVTYLAGPMQALGWSGSGWRVYFASLLKKYNICVQDPVKSESKKTGFSPTNAKKMLKTLTILTLQGDREAEKKFLRMMNRIELNDFMMVDRSDFIVAQTIEDTVSIGTTAEIFRAAEKKIPIYALYVGRSKNLSYWLLSKIIASGGKVFTTRTMDGLQDCMKKCLQYLLNKFELEELERNGKNGKHRNNRKHNHNGKKRKT